ncbi:MAG: CoA ester lyase [Pseudomonadota bacterium]
MVFRSLLFVPGARPDRFDKAVGSGADTIIIDLEDAVLPPNKDAARKNTLAWLAARGSEVKAGVRINSLRSADGCADVAALAASNASPDFIMVPKADTRADVEIVGEAGRARALMGVIESPLGLTNASEIAQASTGGILFGGADYSAALGANLEEWDAMLWARSTIANACSVAGVPAYDVPYLDTVDEVGLIEQTRRVKALGFNGRSCIHPNQVSNVNGVFTPSAEEITEAKEIIESLERAEGGAALHKGKLVDRPVILAAERTLALVDF